MKRFSSIKLEMVLIFLFSIAIFSSNSFVSIQAQKIVNPINISNNTGQSVYPDVAVGLNNMVYVAWQDNNNNNSGGINNTKGYDIYFKRSINGGASFETHPIKLSDKSYIGSSEFPQIAASGNNVYVVWQYHVGQKSDIYFKRSINGGASFEANTIKLGYVLHFANNPQIAASGNNVYVVWQDNATKGKNTFFTKSNDGGNTFGKVVDLGNNNNNNNSNPTNTNVSYPKVAAYGNNVYVTWDAYSSDYNTKTGKGFKINKVIFRASNDDGINFGKTIEINHDVSSPSSSLQIAAASSDGLYFLWDNYNNSSSNSDILFKKTVYGANTFGKVVDLSNTDGDSKNPDIAVGTSLSLSENKKNSNVFVLWEDDSAVNWEIFLTKSTDGGNTFGNVVNLSNNEEYSSCPHIATNGDNAYVVWEDGDLDNREIFFMKA
jgi:hypothetical protein